MRISILLGLISFTLVFLFSICNIALAQDSEIGQSLIHPASPIYFLKTIREDLELKFALTPKVQILRKLEFATRRLREVNSLIVSSHLELIQSTLEKYWFHIRELPDSGITDEQIVERISSIIGLHLKVLETIYDQVSNVSARMSIRTAINRLTQRIDLSKDARLSACSFLAKEASSSGLTEVERIILLERSQKCFK